LIPRADTPQANGLRKEAALKKQGPAKNSHEQGNKKTTITPESLFIYTKKQTIKKISGCLIL
jgi:hypothetical protein